MDNERQILRGAAPREKVTTIAVKSSSLIFETASTQTFSDIPAF
jgi:hypothetical protein